MSNADKFSSNSSLSDWSDLSDLSRNNTDNSSESDDLENSWDILTPTLSLNQINNNEEIITQSLSGTSRSPETKLPKLDSSPINISSIISFSPKNSLSSEEATSSNKKNRFNDLNNSCKEEIIDIFDLEDMVVESKNDIVISSEANRYGSFGGNASSLTYRAPNSIKIDGSERNYVFSNHNITNGSGFSSNSRVFNIDNNSLNCCENICVFLNAMSQNISKFFNSDDDINNESINHPCDVIEV